MGTPHTEAPWSSNDSFYQPPVLLLTGIPGMDRSLHRLVSIPFCILYLVALSGNCTILFVVQRTPTLHEPMYYFLSMLAVVDLSLVLCTLPTTLGIFWFDIRTIGFDACLIQMYFIHIVSVLESSVLLAMAFDRFVAIAHPLRYKAILTEPTIVKIGLAIVVRAVVSLLPIPFLLKRLTYCRNNCLSHSFCFHPDIMKLACADIHVNVLYGLVVILSTAGLDAVFIVLSYFLIIRTVIRLGSQGRCCSRVLKTCFSHICAFLIFIIPMIGLPMIHRFVRSPPPIVNSLVAYVYLIVPPALNPIVYSIKSKQIWKAILRMGLGKEDPL